MGRKTVTVRVPRFEGTDNRDLDKSFFLTEWPASTSEKWAMRMLLAFNRSAGEIPLNLAGIGMEGIAILGINTFLRGAIQAAEIIPLLDELLECVKIVRDPDTPDKATGEPVVHAIIPDIDIEEVATRLWLRSEVLRLHTNFSPADALSKLLTSIQTPTKTTESTLST